MRALEPAQVLRFASVVAQSEIVKTLIREVGSAVAVDAARDDAKEMQAAYRIVIERLRFAIPREKIEPARGAFCLADQADPE